jgi:hypothetical protein
VTKQRTATTAVLATLAVIVIGVFLVRSPTDSEFTEPEERLDSPRLTALAKDFKAGDRAALDRLWGELQGKAP